jgi:hypothetical protein
MLSAQRRLNPEAYRLLTLGQGLEDVAIPAAQHFDLLERAMELADSAPASTEFSPA